MSDAIGPMTLLADPDVAARSARWATRATERRPDRGTMTLRG